MSWTRNESLRGLTSPYLVTDNVRLAGLTYTRFAALVVEGGLQHVATMRWETRGSLEPLRGAALSSVRGEHYERALLDAELETGTPCLVYVNLHRGVVWAEAATERPEALAVAEAWLRSVLPPAEPTVDQRVPVAFWSAGPHGPAEVSRTIAVPAWVEVAANYPASVRRAVDPLLVPGWRPDAGGRLLLWHGPPGTGKTYALRALAWEWRDWCALHYVSDPERFFGSAQYMLDVLLSGTEDDEDEDDDDDRGVAAWRLLVLEDTGELLTADAKERTGQGLSRLLNVVDGLIGQGLRVLVLVTTNEPVAALHPAVSRPGRCLAVVEFEGFPPGEAAAWLAAHGAADFAPRRATVAELYAILEGRAREPRKHPIGFGLQPQSGSGRDDRRRRSESRARSSGR